MVISVIPPITINTISIKDIVLVAIIFMNGINTIHKHVMTVMTILKSPLYCRLVTYLKTLLYDHV